MRESAGAKVECRVGAGGPEGNFIGASGVPLVLFHQATYEGPFTKSGLEGRTEEIAYVSSEEQGDHAPVLEVWERGDIDHLDELLAAEYVNHTLAAPDLPLLRVAAAWLIGESVLVAANHGDCPPGGLQERLGDPVPLFELVLSPRAAKRAVPTLGVIAGAGLALLLVRGRYDGA